MRFNNQTSSLNALCLQAFSRRFLYSALFILVHQKKNMTKMNMTTQNGLCPISLSSFLIPNHKSQQVKPVIRFSGKLDQEQPGRQNNPFCLNQSQNRDKNENTMSQYSSGQILDSLPHEQLMHHMMFEIKSPIEAGFRRLI
jgi:hypothetical protein